MSQSHGNLSRLVGLAKETSSEKRRELLNEVTDLFMDAPSGYTSNQAEQFGDILGTVAREMEMAVRQTLATRLSSVPNAPRNLILQLANDEIEVARPVLRNSVVLKDADMIALAKLKGQDHLFALSERREVSEQLSDAIVARGDGRVLTQLASNAGAKLSRGSMETLAERAETVASLQKPLISRTDLPPDLMNSMFFAVSSELKRVIMDRMKDLDPSVIDEAIRSTERRIKRRTGPDPEQARADAFMASLAKSGTITESLLVSLTKQKRFEEVAIVFSKLTLLELKVAKKVMADPNPEALAIASRACRFDRQTFSTLALNRETGTMTGNEAYELLDLYDKIPVETAQRVMRFWRVRAGVSERAAA